MLDTDYADRRTAIVRPCRMPEVYCEVMRDRTMQPAARALACELLIHPPKWQITVAYIVKNLDYGNKDTVRKLLRQIIASGRMRVVPERYADGRYKRGIYLISAEPIWLDAVDICDDENRSEMDDISQGKATERGRGFSAPGIDKSIVNPDTDTRRQPVENCPPDLAGQAEPGQGRANAHLTGKAEPRANPAPACGDRRGAAKAGNRPLSRCLSDREQARNERREGAAKGSAVKGRASTACHEPDEFRNIERHRAQLIGAGGRALADHRRTPALWNLGEVLRWLAAGYDFERDILATIRAIAARPGLEPGQVRSWKYFTEAIRAAHCAHTGRPLPKPAPKFAPRLDPYAPPPRDPDCDGSAWQPIGMAALIGARRK